MTATVTIPEAALELADLQARLTIMSALAGQQASMLVGEPECQYHLGQLAALREATTLIADRMAAMTVGGGR